MNKNDELKNMFNALLQSVTTDKLLYLMPEYICKFYVSGNRISITFDNSEKIIIVDKLPKLIRITGSESENDDSPIMYQDNKEESIELFIKLKDYIVK